MLEDGVLLLKKTARSQAIKKMPLSRIGFHFVYCGVLQVTDEADGEHISYYHRAGARSSCGNQGGGWYDR